MKMSRMKEKVQIKVERTISIMFINYKTLSIDLSSMMITSDFRQLSFIAFLETKDWYKQRVKREERKGGR